MRMAKSLVLAILLCLVAACTPRDFLKRRLAGDLIAGSDTFKAPQLFWLRTGIVSNLEFSSPESLVLQRRGWIIGTEERCPEGVEPPPCWEVVLSPLGVDAVRPLIPGAIPEKGPLALPVARREFLAVSGISKAGNFADVDFIWHWVALNPLGAALYDGGVRYRSTVGFRSFDDGWRVIEQPVPSNQPLDVALRNAQAIAP